MTNTSKTGISSVVKDVEELEPSSTAIINVNGIIVLEQNCQFLTK